MNTPPQQRNMESEQNTGLYVPQLEKDECGVGFIANLENIPSFKTLDSALQMLENMEHRGACGCEENTGDGAGILTQIPHDLLKKELATKEVELPQKDKYGVGVFFFPKDTDKKAICDQVIRKYSLELDFKILCTRIVPTSNRELGDTALKSEPIIQQLIFKSTGFNNKDIERRLYLMRSMIAIKVYTSHPELRDDFYVASLSSKTIVYKGLLTATQLRGYYKDLQNVDFKTALAIVHSRFSTNTVPKWKLAQPFRCIAHNGEINTIQGNINWWKARENHLSLVSKDQPELTKIFPVCDPYISDSGNFDNVVDFLLRASRSIPHSIMMMIPEAWQNNDELEEYKKYFYEYHDAIMEPWDGPASICFTDGVLVGATLDRNGLRPARYLVTHDNFLILASEVGCLDIPDSNIKYKSRLQPGKMLVADLEEHRIISDEELKDTICLRKPYKKWVNENTLYLEEMPEKEMELTSNGSLIERQLSVGFSKEDKKLILRGVLEKSKEPIGSMGCDIPLAVLSKKDQHISNYFKQQFAQVTNPPIDSLREKYYMSLSTACGTGSKIIGVGPAEATVIRTETPVLLEKDLKKLLTIQHHYFKAGIVASTIKIGSNLQERIKQLCNEVEKMVTQGINVICLSDRTSNEKNATVPSLLLTGALHHFLIERGLRKELILVVDSSDIWETHHAATLLSYGADLLCPYLAFQSISELCNDVDVQPEDARAKYQNAMDKGILKIMSKLGVSTLASYKAAQTFEALGISKEVVDVCFKGTVTRIGGLYFSDLQKEMENKHQNAFGSDARRLENDGIYQWRRKGEYHLFNPTTIHLLQHSTASNNYETYKKFATEIDRLETNSSVLRSYLSIKQASKSIPISEVESVDSILKRFVTGAMSFGSLSMEAHSTLALAMNRIGGKSNSGEGGEDESRYELMENGDSSRSAIKQVASGRFGVNIHYLTNADELQIKVAQGAKPGEGGQLPGHKVDENIARVRNSTPGVGLISPPPHHDIYSIEDLAQLIFDLKNSNPAARISVKLVSKAGVGIIASGVTKAHAEHILISGFDGGTGASPLSSIRHAGLPWEIGLSETHQTLMKNGLRDRVVLQTDGQIRTGRDLAIASLLGAEEWGVATAALVVEGCILMRKCHLNTCPVGIATQDKELRTKYNGKVEHVINYFKFMAQHLREIMASLGIKKINDLVGRTDLLEIRNLDKHWKTKNLNLDTLLFQESHPANKTMYQSKAQEHGLNEVLDQKLIAKTKNALQYNTLFASTIKVESTDRAVGTMLSHELTKKYGKEGMKKESIQFRFEGSAGQSFGAFGARGLRFNLVGEANDYFGKGLSGATISVAPNREASFEAQDNIIVGNVALYGATSGEAYINGRAGDRFCVRNSGAKVVVEGVGDNACEYMTGGCAVILGSIGRNFAAGMSGGLAFIYNFKPTLNHLINEEMVLLEKPNPTDMLTIYRMLTGHLNNTGSKYALRILNSWENNATLFTKVHPIEYKRAMEQMKQNKSTQKKAS